MRTSRSVTLLVGTALVAGTAIAGTAVAPSWSAPAAGRGDVDLRTGAHLTISGTGSFAELGTSVSGAGDVNGDRRADIVVGAPLASPGGRFQAGAAYVVFGSKRPSRLVSSRLGRSGFAITGSKENGSVGQSVAGAGDVNGDGLDDVAVSEPRGVFVVFGSERSVPVDLARPGRSGFLIASAGLDVSLDPVAAGVGDVNDDGYDDVAVGLPDAAPAGRRAAGATYVVFGSARPVGVSLAGLGSAGFEIAGAAPDDDSGSAVAGAGDVNGDGLADIVVGAFKASPFGREWAGAAYVVLGSRSPAPVDLAQPGDAARVIAGAAGGDWAGISVDGAGDVNGDGFDDVVLGAPQVDARGREDAGASYVVLGSAAMADVDLALLNGRGFEIDGAEESDGSAEAVAGAGDVNGDGLDDVLVGAWLAGVPGRTWPGVAYVVLGSAEPRAIDLAHLGRAGYALVGTRNENSTGESVAGAGDVNRDGLDDVVVGAPEADRGDRTDAGQAYVVLGRR